MELKNKVDLFYSMLFIKVAVLFLRLLAQDYGI